MKALVVGGGPAGLAAAIALRERGLRVTVVESRLPGIDKACGEGLLPEAVRLLDDLGVPAVESLGQPFSGIRFLHRQRSLAAHFRHEARGVGIRRTTLHSALVRRAERVGVDLRWGTGARGLEGDAQWIIGADGTASLVRRWAGLEHGREWSRRFAFRRHYRVRPWSDCVDVHWGDGCQLYVTGVGADEVCVAVIARQAMRLDEALPQFPDIEARLSGRQATSAERGSVTVMRRLGRVWRGNIALVGDASGSLDAISGDGLRLAFAQALAVAGAVSRGDLAHYGREHARLRRVPSAMTGLLLTLDRWTPARAAAILGLSACPWMFETLMALHTGTLKPPNGNSELACLPYLR